MPSRKKIVVEMPDGTRKTLTVEMPDEPKTADQKIREQRAPGFDNQTPEQAARAGFLEGAVEGGRGFVKEAVPGLAKGFLNIPAGILGLIQTAATSGVDLVSDPVGTLTRMAESAKDLPAHAQQALHETIQMAANDPEAFGKTVADVTGDTAAGIITGKAIPVAAKPIARKAGPAIEKVAQRVRFPMQISASGAVYSGNIPAAAGLMAAPEVAEYVGQKLTKYGNTIPVEAQLARGGARTGAIRQTRAPGTVVSSVPPTAAAGPRAQAEIARELGKALDDIKTPAQAGLKDLDSAIEAEKKRAGAIRTTARKTEASARKAEEAADLAKLNADQTAAAGAESTIASELDDALSGSPAREGLADVDSAIEAERKAAAGRRRTSERRESTARKAEEAADLSQTRSEAAAKAAEDQGLTPLERELLKRATSVTPVGRGPKVSVTPAATRAADVAEDIFDEVDLTDDITAQAAAPDLRSRAAERFGRNFVDEGATTPAGRGLPQELLDQAEELPEPPPGLDIPASRSRRSPLSSVDDRLTENDFDTLRQIVAENPGISTSEASQLLLEERAARSRMYRTQAGMDRGARDAFDLDE